MMTFEKLLSDALSWPVQVFALGVAMVVIGWRNCRLNERRRKFECRLSKRGFWTIAIAAGVVASARITFEHWPELYRETNSITQNTGIEAWWMIVVFAIIAAGFMTLTYFVLINWAIKTKKNRLMPRLDKLRERDAEDRELAARAARDPLEGCKFGIIRKNTNRIQYLN